MLRTIFVFHFIAFLCHAISSCGYFTNNEPSVASNSDTVVLIEALPEEIATDTAIYEPVIVICKNCAESITLEKNPMNLISRNLP